MVYKKFRNAVHHKHHKSWKLVGGNISKSRGLPNNIDSKKGKKETLILGLKLEGITAATWNNISHDMSGVIRKMC